MLFKHLLSADKILYNISVMGKSLHELKSGTDVRGVAVGENCDLTDTAVDAVVRAFAVWLGGRLGKTRLKIAVGNDSRISADRIVGAVCAALNDSGCDAVYTGLSSTPSMFILLKKSDFGCDASIMVTASHLPYDRNGLKFFTPQGGLDGGDIDEILAIAVRGESLHGHGLYSEKSFMDEYSRILTESVRTACGRQRPLAGLKIIVDAGNGAGGFFAEKVLKPLGADTSGSQFLQPDGYFPNHIPNPEDGAAIGSLSAAVIREGADLGIIFDTDVDRAGAVDRSGAEINRCKLIALTAYMLKETGGTVVTDSVTGDRLTEFIEKLGLRHLRYKRGYKNVIDEAVRRSAEGEFCPLAIETSGHAAFYDNYYLDDGAYLMTRILILLARQTENGGNLVSLISSMPDPAEEREVRLTFTPFSRDFRAEGAQAIEHLKAFALSRDGITPAKDNYEGIKLGFGEGSGDGWCIVRMSVHDPVMPIYFESDKKGGIAVMADILRTALSEFAFLNTENLSSIIQGENNNVD